VVCGWFDVCCILCEELCWVGEFGFLCYWCYGCCFCWVVWLVDVLGLMVLYVEVLLWLAYVYVCVVYELG